MFLSGIQTILKKKPMRTTVPKLSGGQFAPPNDIDFSEGYFGLLLARLQYAQAHDDRNEQKRIFRKMKSCAEKTDYSEYKEENKMLEAIKTLQLLYGYQ